MFIFYTCEKEKFLQEADWWMPNGKDLTKTGSNDPDYRFALPIFKICCSLYSSNTEPNGMYGKSVHQLTMRVAFAKDKRTGISRCHTSSLSNLIGFLRFLPTV